MVQNNEFMLVFRYEPNSNYQPTEAEMADMHQQWGAFIGNIAIQEKLVSTHQQGCEGKQLFADKSVVEGIHVSGNQALGGNMIVKANSMDEAVGMAKNCPRLYLGGKVAERAIQPM